MPLTWKDRIKVAVASGGTGTLTLGSAASGYQTFAAGDDAKLFPYVIENGTAWETGYGTYTHAGTTFARTSRTASSSGSAIDAGTGNLYVDLVSNNADHVNLAAQAIIPGGRLTLESGVPVSTTDQSAKTSIYYTPYVNNCITLWDGNIWKTITFTETRPGGTTLTATNGKPYDVFAYLSSGALALETLVWTNDTTRATAVTLQDGRYCKSGDKTRLLLGSFYASATDQTSDTALLRYVSNVYNQEPRGMRTGAITGASHTYGTGTWREWNAGTSVTRLNFVTTLPITPLFGLTFDITTATSGAGYCSIGISETTGDYEAASVASSGSHIVTARNTMWMLAPTTGSVAAGKHYVTPKEFGDVATHTFSNYWLQALVMG